MWEICKSGSVRGIEVPRKVESCGTLDTERQEKQRKQIRPKKEPYYAYSTYFSFGSRKVHTVFCDYNSTNGEHEFGKVRTTPKEIHDLIVSREPERVVLEVCSIAGWVVDIAEALGKETETANTTHDAWRWKNIKKKNDREDALKLAKLSAMSQLPTVHVPTKKVREKRALIKYRQRLIKHRKSIKNAIRAILSREGITSVPRGKNAWSKNGLRRN